MTYILYISDLGIGSAEAFLNRASKSEADKKIHLFVNLVPFSRATFVLDCW